MFEWGIIPPGKTQAINKKELALGETVKDQARYEADLSSLQKPDSLKIACRMIAYWYNDGEKVNQPDTGKAKTSVIKPPSFKLKVKELAFNTVKGEIDSDSFDIQETINGKDISVPEFKDGKEQQGTVVAYPAQSRPIITNFSRNCPLTIFQPNNGKISASNSTPSAPMEMKVWSKAKNSTHERKWTWKREQRIIPKRSRETFRQQMPWKMK